MPVYVVCCLFCVPPLMYQLYASIRCLLSVLYPTTDVSIVCQYMLAVVCTVFHHRCINCMPVYVGCCLYCIPPQMYQLYASVRWLLSVLYSTTDVSIVCNYKLVAGCFVFRRCLPVLLWRDCCAGCFQVGRNHAL